MHFPHSKWKEGSALQWHHGNSERTVSVWNNEINTESYCGLEKESNI